MSKVVPDPPYAVFVAHEDLSFEDAIASISSLLRCAATTATETAEGLKGTQRDLACSTAHLIEMARTLADRALDCLQPKPTNTP
ncbi:hypothetical protein SAMN05216475_1681 [Pseudomonas synxantha]|uniref:DUF3077 domain-containing protein n=1 Tax=Pseudomonas synxantha TaxID=47883 RepID=A0AAX3I524_9PSED|nr:hypothetical protein [Pseudomonas synxantha]AZE67660.1 hypothetical protein C4K01_3467 [Pseudomonas synxantha]KRP43666.1 hypothetical protein TU77_29750 [Pseudomonas synxantha]SDU20552.1 hypothetical protein SAMN05216475_1681 [Pseudomonas synxantha]VTQ97991.1 Uncharacterised protein [Pseudomonas synxantha]